MPRGPNLCPSCGNVLSENGAPDDVAAGRHLLRELLFWAALALILAFLWSTSGTAERVGALGAIALLVWLRQWLRRREAQRAPIAPGGYRCDYCRQQFERGVPREPPAC